MRRIQQADPLCRERRAAERARRAAAVTAEVQRALRVVLADFARWDRERRG